MPAIWCGGRTLIAECPALAKEVCTEFYDSICTQLHFYICKQLGVKVEKKWCTHITKLFEMSQDN